MYHDIPSKTALIVGLYNTVLAGLIPATASPEPWQDGLKTLARQYCNLALRHSKLFPSLIVSNDYITNAYRAFERLYGLMLESGLSLEKIVYRTTTPELRMGVSKNVRFASPCEPQNRRVTTFWTRVVAAV